MKTRALLIIAFALFTLHCSAQSRRNSKKNPEQSQQQPSSLNPDVPKEQTQAPKKNSKKKAGRGATYSAEARYYERVEKLEKVRAKEEKLKAKPQYSDPMYFGHKRPPKKNKRGKLKYCKECGIRH